MKRFMILTFTLCLSIFTFTSCSNVSEQTEQTEQVKEYNSVKNENEKPIKDEIILREESKQEKKTITIHKIYYYNPVDDIIVYKNVDATEKEGMEIGFFKDRFSNPPGKNISPNMPKTTVINSIKVDKDKSIVTMDVSENFTANMNIGSGVESSILQSIANTLCETYGVDRLLITTNGGEYQGSHIEINGMNIIAKNTVGAKPVE